jgi:hypothetical protein
MGKRKRKKEIPSDGGEWRPALLLPLWLIRDSTTTPSVLRNKDVLPVFIFEYI